MCKQCLILSWNKSAEEMHNLRKECCWRLMVDGVYSTQEFFFWHKWINKFINSSWKEQERGSQGHHQKKKQNQKGREENNLFSNEQNPGSSHYMKLPMQGCRSLQEMERPSPEQIRVPSTQEFGMASIKGPWVLGGLWKASVLKEDPFPAAPLALVNHHLQCPPPHEWAEWQTITRAPAHKPPLELSFHTPVFWDLDMHLWILPYIVTSVIVWVSTK